MIFEESRREVGPEDADRIVRVLADYHEPGLVASQPGRQNRFGDVLAELRLLHEGLKRFDAAAFRLRFQTGLEQPIEPADVDLEPAERTRQLIDRLQDDEELGGLARIARQMLAAIHLPRAISDREDLPVGGVSDISNRGPLDRLLLSELAHDDLTLAVRIAMNEALYLRRETPPSNPPKHRAVLLDSGVRLWGVPRVFATAVGMALAAGAQRNVRTDVFRAASDDVVPVSLVERAGVVAHLETLEPDAHPGRSLAAFAATASAEAGLLDAVIVTSEDVAADHEFQRSLAALELPSLLLATVSREGRFRLVSQGRRGSKLLREATLDLEKLLAPPARRQAPLIDPSLPADLPAILAARPFPLFLSYQPFDPGRAWKAPWGGVLSISKDRCLFYWQVPARGARLVSDRLPAGAIHWTGSAADGAASLAMVGMLQQGALWLVRVDSAAEKCAVVALALQDGHPQAVCGHAGTVFVIYPDRIDLFETAGGAKIKSAPVPSGLSWRRDRFFGSTQWHALSFDGFKPVFEPLLVLHNRPLAEHVLTFVDASDMEGPVGIMDDGSIFRLGEERSTPVNHGLDWPRALGGRLALGKRCRTLRRKRQEPPRGFAERPPRGPRVWRCAILARSAFLRSRQDRPAERRAEPVLQDLRRSPGAAVADFPQIRVGDFPGGQPSNRHGKPAGGNARQATRRRVPSRGRAARRRLFVASRQMEGRQSSLARLARHAPPEKLRSLDPRGDPRAARRRLGGLDAPRVGPSA